MTRTPGKLNLGEAKVQQVKGSYVVTLPMTWARSHNLQKGDTIEFTLNSDMELILKKKVEKKVKKEQQK